MKTTIFTAAIFSIAAATLSTISVSSPLPSRTPIVLELFTSEGCSDCPPADKVLQDLTERQPIDGASIIPLEEHINYWDNPKHWVDPYSLSQVTNRQYDYAARFNDDSPYTPEMVVDGGEHLNGSDEASAIAALRRAKNIQSAKVGLSVQRVSDFDETVTVSVMDIPSAEMMSKVAVILAVTEDDLVSHVAGGENRGRTLAHSAVVRSLNLVGFLTGSASSSYQATVDIPLAWRQHPLHAAAFLQDTVTKRIYGAREIEI